MVRPVACSSCCAISSLPGVVSPWRLPTRGENGQAASTTGARRSRCSDSEVGLGLDGLRARRERRGLAQARQEQRLVDPSLEDRHPEFHALGDHVPALQARFPRELRGREVIRHWAFPPLWELQRFPGTVAFWADGLNVSSTHVLCRARNVRKLREFARFRTGLRTFVF